VPHSSRGSARAYIFELDPSLYVILWWALLHGLLAAAIVLLGAALAATTALIAALGAHAVVRYPCAPRLLVLYPDGAWTVPERGAYGRKLAPGTTWSPWYVELVLVGCGGARILIVRDQLGAEDWRRLKLAVRERGCPEP
jgi:hypothetical protein